MAAGAQPPLNSMLSNLSDIIQFMEDGNEQHQERSRVLVALDLHEPPAPGPGAEDALLLPLAEITSSFDRVRLQQRFRRVPATGP